MIFSVLVLRFFHFSSLPYLMIDAINAFMMVMMIMEEYRLSMYE
jgi:hypothetical protein